MPSAVLRVIVPIPPITPRRQRALGSPCATVRLHGASHLPAEAVYAVFEVKQTLDAAHVAYTAGKAASVRRLHRTSAPVIDIRRQTPVKPPIPILAGLLTTDVGWAPENVAGQLHKQVEGLDGDQLLDLVCVAESQGFEILRGAQGTELHASTPETGLVFFLFSFLQRLQQLGAVAPINFGAYRAAL